MFVQPVEIPDDGRGTIERGRIQRPTFRISIDNEPFAAARVRRGFKQPLYQPNAVRIVMARRTLALRATDKHDLTRYGFGCGVACHEKRRGNQAAEHRSQQTRQRGQGACR